MDWYQNARIEALRLAYERPRTEGVNLTESYDLPIDLLLEEAEEILQWLSKGAPKVG